MFNQAPKAPLRYVSGNVVYGRGGLGDGWACFVLAPGGSDYRPLASRLATIRSLSQFLTRVKRDGQLVRMARQWPAERYLQGRRERPSPLSVLRDLELRLLDEQQQLIVEKGIDAALPRIFLALRLSEQRRDLQERITSGSSGRRAVERFGVAGRMIRDGLLPESQREADQQQAQSLLAELGSFPALASAVPASSADIQWWVRRVYGRGLPDPRVDAADAPQGVMVVRDGRAAVRPLEVDLLRWTGGVESHPVLRPDHVVCSSPEGGTAVQQTLMATSWHDTADSAERALGLALVAPRQVDWPLDLAVSWEWHSNQVSRRAMDSRSKATLEDAKQESSSQLGVSDRTGEAYAASHGLLARLEVSGEPTLRAVVSAAIAVPVEDGERASKAVADAVRELRQRSRITRSLVEQRCGVTLQVPPVQQVEAMQQMLPAQPNLLPGYARISLPDQVAVQGWTSGTDVGSESGWLWARTVSMRPQPVRIDFTDPARLGCAAGVLWVGDSGGGKTFAAGLALVLAVLGGAWVVNSDPKGDHKWHRVLPAELVHEIRLDHSDRQQWGMLDPFLVAEPARRADVAVSWLSSLLPRQSTAAMEVALREAIADVTRNATDPTCTDVLERLGERAGEDHAAELVLRALRASSEGGLARLAFAEPGHTGIRLGAAQVTSIVSNTFVRPKSGVPRDQWKPIEVASMGLVELVGHLTTRLVGEQRDTLKILNSDEAHADLATDLGRGQIDSAQRMGRSEMLVPSLATQAPSDLTDAGLKNLFGQYVLFRALDEAEAVAALTLAGLDVDEEIVTKLVELPQGRALMRDYRGRTEWVDVLAPATYRQAVAEAREFEALDEFSAA